jgi:hypothetical protein
MGNAQNKAARLGAAKYYTRQQSKRFPAYGKQLMEQRLAGQAPRNVYCVFDWDLARTFSRVVIPEGIAPDQLELRYLAGLDVCVAYRTKDAAKVPELSREIIRVNPHILNALNVDLPQNAIIKNLAGEIML